MYEFYITPFTLHSCRLIYRIGRYVVRVCIHFNTYVRGAGTRQTMNEWEYNQVCFFLQNSKRPMGFSKNYFAAGLTVFRVWRRARQRLLGGT